MQQQGAVRACRNVTIFHSTMGVRSASRNVNIMHQAADELLSTADAAAAASPALCLAPYTTRDGTPGTSVSK